MTNPAVLSRKEVDRWCRELIHENKEKDKEIAELRDKLKRFISHMDIDWLDQEEMK